MKEQGRRFEADTSREDIHMKEREHGEDGLRILCGEAIVTHQHSSRLPCHNTFRMDILPWAGVGGA